MKKLTLLFLIILSSKSISQTKNFIDLPYIETSARVDTLVIPDRIYLKIIISEKDTKNEKSVEELENLMERAVIMARGDTITYIDLPRTGLETTPTKEVHIDFSDNKIMELSLEEFLDGCEKTYIEKLLEKNKGKIDQSAGEAAVDPKTLYRKMKKYLLTKKAFKTTTEQ